MGQKNLAVLFTSVFFLQENVWRFLPGGQKKWRRNKKVAVRRGFTVNKLKKTHIFEQSMALNVLLRNLN